MSLAALILALCLIQSPASPCPSCDRTDCRWPSSEIRVGLDPRWSADDRAALDAALTSATSTWEAGSGVEFRRVSERSAADVWISPGRSDGPGGVFGESERPCEALRSDRVSDARLDPADVATLDRRTLARAAAHELGHSLGLEHSDNRRDVMFSRLGTGPLRLGPGDVAGAMIRYGPP